MPRPTPARPDPTQTLLAPQKYGVMGRSAANGIRYLGTTGLNRCVGFVLYDAQGKAGVVAHFDQDGAEQDRYDSRRVAAELIKKLAAKGALKACIVWGEDQSSDTRINGQRLRAACEAKGVAVEEFKPLKGNVVLDLATGGVDWLSDGVGAVMRDAQWFARAIAKRGGGGIDIYRLQLTAGALQSANRYQPATDAFG